MENLAVGTKVMVRDIIIPEFQSVISLETEDNYYVEYPEKDEYSISSQMVKDLGLPEGNYLQVHKKDITPIQD